MESSNGMTPKRGKGWGVKHLVCMRPDTESKTLWNWLPIQFSGGRKDPFSSSSLPSFDPTFSLCCTSFKYALLYIYAVKSYIFLLMKIQILLLYIYILETSIAVYFSLWTPCRITFKAQVIWPTQSKGEEKDITLIS